MVNMFSNLSRHSNLTLRNDFVNAKPCTVALIIILPKSCKLIVGDWADKGSWLGRKERIRLYERKAGLICDIYLCNERVVVI